MWPFRFKGMIKPGMAMGFDDSRKIMLRKSADLVLYLRARRAPHLGMMRYHRRQHLDQMKGSK